MTRTTAASSQAYVNLRLIGSIHPFYSPYITVLCSFVNHDPWQDNTRVITSSNRPFDTTCCCHGRSQQRPELRVVRPWFDMDGHCEDEDFVALPTEIGQKCGPAGLAQNF
eukprot:scaffold32155_cov51-Cyclotella_meneghiniana.AAC.3